MDGTFTDAGSWHGGSPTICSPTNTWNESALPPRALSIARADEECSPREFAALFGFSTKAMVANTVKVIRLKRFRARLELVNQPARNSSATLARTDSRETQTGKKMAARAIDGESAQPPGPTATLNCGAMPGHLVEDVRVPREEVAWTDATVSISGRAHAPELAIGKLQYRLLQSVGTQLPTHQYREWLDRQVDRRLSG